MATSFLLSHELHDGGAEEDEILCIISSWLFVKPKLRGSEATLPSPLGRVVISLQAGQVTAALEDCLSIRDWIHGVQNE